MYQVQSPLRVRSTLCFVTIIVLAAQYWFAAPFIKRYEALLFFIISWLLSLTLLYLMYAIGYGKTFVRSVMLGAAVGYIVVLIVHPVLDALNVQGALAAQLHFFQKDPVAASVLFFGGHFLLGGWLSGICLSLLLKPLPVDNSASAYTTMTP
jgi:hypothetical protein